MAGRQRMTRTALTLGAAALVAAVLTAAFWPRAVMVDLGAVRVGPLVVTIDEEGRTEVSEPYVVATPVAGRLQRVEVHPGDPAVRGETVVARMLPTNPAALDVRTREQAQAALAAAEAALRVAEADRNAAVASRDLASAELARVARLAESQIASSAALDRASQQYKVTEASVETAEAAIAMRRAEVANARALLIGFDDARTAPVNGVEDIPLYAPADGVILRIMQESETTLPAGAPIMEIGDVEGDLQVVVELVSSDAVAVRPGARVMIGDWGGPETLDGRVRRIDPFAVTKISALGVEEQRVPVTIEIVSPREAFAGLGHGYRVEARIVIWEAGSVLKVPTSALFRDGGGGWAVFVMTDGRAELRPVETGRSDGLETELRGGLVAGDEVVLYPGTAVADGIRITRRVAE